MKKIFLDLIYLTCMILLFSSCKKDFLETEPTDQYATKYVFTTTANCFAAVNGMHRAMYQQYSTQAQCGQGSVNINCDMLGEDLVQTSSGNTHYNAAYRWEMHRDITHADLRFIYRFYYKLIANANMILANIDKATGSEADKDIIRGQAYAYRGWAHFMLVQFFGQRYDATAVPNNQLGVPILTTNTFEGQPRATVEEVYAQVNNDLDSAMVNLATYVRPNKSHIDLRVVQGLKARVALTMQNWTAAATYAALARTGFTLMSNTEYTSGFNDYTNSEWMWGCKVIADQQTYFYSFFAYMSYNFSSTNIRGNPKAINRLLYNQIPATDIRRNLWIVSTTGPTNPIIPSTHTRKAYMNVKFKAVSESDSRGDHCWMRAAEMYLIEAEALSRLGQSTPAAALLFSLVSPRNPSYVQSTSTGAALTNQILLYRRIELWGEGFRFLDLKRLNMAVDRTASNHTAALARLLTIPAGTVDWQFFIPEDEMNANPALEGQQNP